jgi:hypothetical integral membrane protein (TIGR02206 family)
LATTFEPYSVSHWIILLILSAGTALCILLRLRRGREVGRRVDLLLGWLNLLWWLTASGLQLLPGRWDWGRSLPIQACDVSALAAAAAMFWNARLGRALLYYVGVGLSSWALCTPDLDDGPATLEFWIFFVGHGATVGAAVYDIAARGYRPGWRDFALATGAMIAWMAIVVPLNATFGWNYGYTGNQLTATANPIHFLGPWPWRLLWLALGVIALFALMTLPWVFRRHHRIS